MKGYGQKRLALCAAGERALALAVSRAGRQVTYRDMARVWSEANTAFGIELPTPPNWVRMLTPAIVAGRVLSTQSDGSIYFTTAGGADLPIPQSQPVFTKQRMEIAAAAERALAVALQRHGRQVTWKEVRACWAEANGQEVATYKSVTSWGWIFEPSVRSGAVLVTRTGQGTYYALSSSQLDALPQKAKYTQMRLDKCAAAVEVIRRALAKAGCQVTWPQIADTWAEVATSSLSEVSTGWLYLIAPALQDGTVVATKAGSSVYYTVAGEAYLIPERPAQTDWLLEQGAAAVKALDALLDRIGCQATYEQLVTELGLPEDGGLPKVKYYLRAPVRERQVVVTRSGTRSYLTTGDRRDLPIPAIDPGPRMMGPRVEGRISRLIAAIGRLEAQLKRMVDSRELLAELGPEGRARSFRNDIDLAKDTGLIRAVFANGHWYFSLPDSADLEPPQYANDGQRVEEAVRRATERLRSAVLFGDIQIELDSDPELRLTGNLALANVLGTLRQWERVKTTAHLRPQTSRLVYHYLPGGPHWVRPEAEHHLDRRLRAVRGLWRASGGRPFTTAALRRYARTRQSLQFCDDKPYMWTGALQALTENGDLVRIKQDGLWQVRWAPRSEWEQLSQEVQAQRLSDPFRNSEVDEGPNHHLGPTGLFGQEAPEVDAAFISQARNLTSLILTAKALRAAREPNTERRTILKGRPVDYRELEATAVLRPALAPKNRMSTVIRTVARHEVGRRRVALVHVGTVGKVSHYDVRQTEAGTNYVTFLQAFRDADPNPATRREEALRLAANQSALRVVPLPGVVVSTRAVLLRDDLRSRAKRLAGAARRATLLPEEMSQALTRIRHLRFLARRANSYMGPEAMPLSSLRSVESTRIYAVHALDEVGQFFEEGLTPAFLPGRLALAGRVRADPDEAKRMRITRPVQHAIDRVGYACYAAARWGGASLRGLAQQARHAMGELRSPDPFIQAILDPTATPTHAPAAASLAFMADARSRTALADYLARAITNAGAVGGGTTAPAAEAAVYGLGKLPFGSCAAALNERERTVLEATTRDGFDPRIRRLAGRVLQAWDEGWDRKRLLWL